MIITIESIEGFIQNLKDNEYSKNTMEKYRRDLMLLHRMSDARKIEKVDVIDYKGSLCDHYKPRSVNSIIAAWNRYFEYYKSPELKVKLLKIQNEAFCAEEKFLTKQEYKRLVDLAYKTGRSRIGLIMQVICCTGIRISELEYITVEAVKMGKSEIHLKGKTRTILIQDDLKIALQEYIKEHKINKGRIFTTKSGNTIDRSNIWKMMKKIAAEANIRLEKVFPHNLRHLFAREFYKIKKDIARLADVLGHSNINTTRIYMMTAGAEHKKILQSMDLLTKYSFTT